MTRPFPAGVPPTPVLVPSASEASAATDPEACLQGAILLAVLAGCPDEEPEYHDDAHESDRAHQDESRHLHLA